LTDITLMEISQGDFDKSLSSATGVIRNMAAQLSARLRRTNQDVLKLSSALSLALSRR